MRRWTEKMDMIEACMPVARHACAWEPLCVLESLYEGDTDWPVGLEYCPDCGAMRGAQMEATGMLKVASIGK